MASLAVRLGVDIGGTFTDVVLERGEEVFSIKVLTTYDAPEVAILDGIDKVCSDANVAPGEIAHIIHGTTLATNALIERSGVKTALITTQGYRDVLEMRTENRFEQYDLNLVLPPPLIARADRYTVAERVSARGEILLELEEDEVLALGREIASSGYESCAIGFIHSYMNDDHERRVRDILQVHMPELSISISSEVSPQMREYERFNTACVNAYIKPLMKSYLDRLMTRLAETGVTCPVFMMHSGGGIMALETASELPVRLVESGPAGGAIFASHIAAGYDLSKVLSFDMGGTTAKICLIENQEPQTARVFEVARTYRFKKGSGMPISIPVIEMVEIGAGGGSLAHVDALRQIRVGPKSAGSEPGPACYQRGGTAPAVTDADLLLGKLDPDDFAGGSIILSTKRSEDAVNDAVGEVLGMDAVSAAFGISEVVDENMANAARVHAVENGKTLSDFTMIAFGGAAPLHAARLCEKLGIARCLIPSGAGVGSAIGFLRAPFGFEATRSIYMRLAAFNAELVNTTMAELAGEAESFVRSCEATAPLASERKCYMRYIGQGWEIPVAVPDGVFRSGDEVGFRQRFEEEYSRLFGRPVDGLGIEIASWSVKVATIVPDVEKQPLHGAQSLGEAATNRVATRKVYDPKSGSFLTADIVSRAALPPGSGLAGPAVITERETSTTVPSGFSAVMQADGCVVIENLALAGVQVEAAQ
jgi:N-methylhydantoinase A